MSINSLDITSASLIGVSSPPMLKPSLSLSSSLITLSKNGSMNTNMSSSKPTVIEEISNDDEVYTWLVERFEEDNWKVDECRVDNGQTLNLYSENIRDDGTKSLARALSSNSTITNIDLGDNNIGDEGTKHLAGVLSTNSTVTTIKLDINNIGDEGAKYLIDALSTNTTVTIIQLGSNSISSLMLSTIDSLVKKNIIFKTTQSQQYDEERDTNSNSQSQQFDEERHTNNNTLLQQYDKECDTSLLSNDREDIPTLDVKELCGVLKEISPDLPVLDGDMPSKSKALFRNSDKYMTVHSDFMGSDPTPDINQQGDIDEQILDVLTPDHKKNGSMKHTRIEPPKMMPVPAAKECEHIDTTKERLIEQDINLASIIMCEGMLQKKKNRKRNLLSKMNNEQWEYFILRKDGFLSSYVSKEEKEKDRFGVRGKNCMVKTIRSTESCNLKMKFLHKKKETSFKVRSNEDVEKWVAAGNNFNQSKCAATGLNKK